MERRDLDGYHERHVDAILDFAHEGFIGADDDGKIVAWNVEAERTFGWRKDEVLGRDYKLIFPPDVGPAIGSSEMLGHRLEVDAIDRDGRRFPVEISVSPLTLDGRSTLNIFVREVSARRRISRYRDAQLAMSDVLARAQSFEQALPEILSGIATGMTWEYAEYWAVDPEAGRMRRTARWCAPDAGLEDFARAGEGITIALDEGAVGIARASGEPTWFEDVAATAYLPRRVRAAQRAQLRTGIALPVAADGDVSGVVLFLTRDNEAADSQLLALLGTLGRQIGHAQVVLHLAGSRRQSVFEDAPIAIAVTDVATSGKFVDVNRAACELFGYPRHELLTRSVRELTHPDDRAATDATRERVMQGDTDRLSYEKRFVRGDGKVISVDVTVAVVRDQTGRPVRTIGHITDVTASKGTAAQLSHEKLHDRVTGLPNRALLLDRLSVALSVRYHQVAVFSIDIDRFTLINESLGYECGDAVLRAISARLTEVVRPSDTVARIGSDQFAIVCDELCHDEAAAIAERLLLGTSGPLAVSDDELEIGVSIGVVLATEKGLDPGDLLRQAETAMQAAKARGGRRYDFFDPTTARPASQRLAMERELRRAIERHEIVPHYQPKVSLRDGGVSYIEALARWNHPDRGLVPPSEFIPLAETTGLILPLGAQILEAACRDVQVVAAESGNAELGVCVNLSPRQFAQPDLATGIALALERTGLPPHRLVVEVTESTLMETGTTVEMLHELKDLGVKLAIDDFGTGSSSLERVRRFPPIDFLKIDRAFVTEMDTKPRDIAIVRAIIEMGHALNCTVVAEGVESEDHATALRDLGCDTAQGYHFGRPCPVDALELVA